MTGADSVEQYEAGQQEIGKHIQGFGYNSGSY